MLSIQTRRRVKSSHTAQEASLSYVRAGMRDLLLSLASDASTVHNDR